MAWHPISTEADADKYISGAFLLRGINCNLSMDK